MTIEIGERVEALRLERGWTKAELSRRSNLSYMHLFKILTGKRTDVGAETVRRLSRALNVSTDYLLGMDHYELRRLHDWGGEVEIEGSDGPQLFKIGCNMLMHQMVVLPNGDVTVC